MTVNIYLIRIKSLVSQQIELIVDLIGTPSVDEIYEISTAKSRELVFNFGQKEPRNLEEVLPDASPEGKSF
jgi:hypothetical protein